MTEQELKELVTEVKNSDMPKDTKKRVLDILYEKKYESEKEEKVCKCQQGAGCKNRRTACILGNPSTLESK